MEMTRILKEALHGSAPKIHKESTTILTVLSLISTSRIAAPRVKKDAAFSNIYI
jgi:hypothetical protein